MKLTALLIVAFVCQKNFVYGYGADWSREELSEGATFRITAREYALSLILM